MPGITDVFTKPEIAITVIVIAIVMGFILSIRYRMQNKILSSMTDPSKAIKGYITFFTFFSGLFIMGSGFIDLKWNFTIGLIKVFFGLLLIVLDYEIILKKIGVFHIYDKILKKIVEVLDKYLG